MTNRHSFNLIEVAYRIRSDEFENGENQAKWLDEAAAEIERLEAGRDQLRTLLHRALGYVDDIANEDTQVKFYVGSAAQLAQEIKVALQSIEKI
jgi:hypothetical protein